MTLARCSPVHAGGSPDQPGGFKLVTPFALDDTAAGALGGNAVAAAVVLLLQMLVAMFVRFVQRKDAAAAFAAARFPGTLLLLGAALHHSTLFSALRLLSDSSNALQVFGGLVGLLVCAAVPLVAVAAIAKVPRRFVRYLYDGPTKESQMNSRVLERGCSASDAPLLPPSQQHAVSGMPSSMYTGAAWLLVLPVGLTMPSTTRAMASSIVTAYCTPAALYGFFPFISSIVTNLVAVLPASAPPALCAVAMAVSAAVHVAMGLWILWAAPYRTPMANLVNPLGLMLTAAFHSQMAAGYREGIPTMLLVESALGIARTVLAVALHVAEDRVKRDAAVGRSRAVWVVGSGGADLLTDGRDDEDGAEMALVVPSPSASKAGSSGPAVVALPERADRDAKDSVRSGGGGAPEGPQSTSESAALATELEDLFDNALEKPQAAPSLHITEDDPFDLFGDPVMIEASSQLQPTGAAEASQLTGGENVGTALDDILRGGEFPCEAEDGLIEERLNPLAQADRVYEEAMQRSRVAAAVCGLGSMGTAELRR